MGIYYSNIENLDLWVRSAKTGFAVIECTVYWNNGMLQKTQNSKIPHVFIEL